MATFRLVTADGEGNETEETIESEEVLAQGDWVQFSNRSDGFELVMLIKSDAVRRIQRQS